MKYLSIPLAFFMLLLFSGCPYQSTVPVSNQPVEWDETKLKAYTGKWICMEDSYDVDSVYIESKTPTTPDNSLIITTWDGLSTKKYNAWLTSLGEWFDDAGILYLLYVEIKQDNKTTYAIYKYAVTGDRAGIYEANPEVFNTISYSTTEELREQILRIHKEKRQNAFGKGIVWMKRNK
ncbi:MAG: hypothetical protein POELPBGB_01142 [Bacteroidia bacterium]|nr:hypothetical protein [Bacteroidia bacterium]